MDVLSEILQSPHAKASAFPHACFRADRAADTSGQHLATFRPLASGGYRLHMPDREEAIALADEKIVKATLTPITGMTNAWRKSPVCRAQLSPDDSTTWSGCRLCTI